MLTANCTHTAQLHTHRISMYAPLSSYIMRTMPGRHAIWPGCPVPHLQGNAEASATSSSVCIEAGYDVKWRRIRAQYLKKEPACEQCGSAGEPHPPVNVDHIVPLSAGEPPTRHSERIAGVVPYRSLGDVLCTYTQFRVFRLWTSGAAIPEKGNDLPTTQSLAVRKLVIRVEQPDHPSPGSWRDQNRGVRRSRWHRARR